MLWAAVLRGTASTLLSGPLAALLLTLTWIMWAIGRYWLSCVLLLCSGWAQAESRSLPEVPIRRTRLRNGLRVVLSADLTSDRVAVCMTYGVGARNDPRGQKGLASLTAELSFLQGPAHGRHHALVHAEGGRSHFHVNHERSQFCELLPVHALSLALWLEAQRMQGPAPTSLQVQTHRRMARNEYLTHVTSQAYAPGRAQLRELVFGPNGAYSAPVWGRMQDLAGLSRRGVEQMRELYGPANAVLSIAGRFQVIQTLRQVHDLFEAFPRRPTQLPSPPPPGTQMAHDSMPVTVEDGNAGSMALLSGWVVPFAGTRARQALSLAAYMLGDGPGSRLWQRLVVEKEVAVWARVATSGERGPGLLRVEVAMEESSQPEAAQQLVMRELKELAEAGPTQQELVNAKRKAWSAAARAHEGELNVARKLGDYELGWDDARKGWRSAASFMRLSASAVRSAVAKYLTKSRRREVIVLPARSRANNPGASFADRQVEP